jgi:hypothetical protein
MKIEDLKNEIYVAWDDVDNFKIRKDPAFDSSHPLSCKCKDCNFKINIYLKNDFDTHFNPDTLNAVKKSLQEWVEASLTKHHRENEVGIFKKHPRPDADWPFIH